MADHLKYAVVERERRYLLRCLPPGDATPRTIVDHYIEGTRLRLREVTHADGTISRKLTHKVRLSEGPSEIACTNFYLDDAEWNALIDLPARTLTKTRYVYEYAGGMLAVDQYADGTLIAEIDDEDRPVTAVPDWLDVIEDVSGDERWTGSNLAT
ncbi:MAG: hypothetical protein ACTHJM_08710 [Marmoricola sp.]